MFTKKRMTDLLTDQVNKELAYDLRQTYAKIVGEHLEDIAQARKADNYAVYFKSLKDLYVIVFHKFKKDKDDKKDKTSDKINELWRKAVVLANQYPSVWIGADKNSDPCALIENALNDIEMFLYKKMSDAGMFGSNKNIPGL